MPIVVMREISSRLVDLEKLVKELAEWTGFNQRAKSKSQVFKEADGDLRNKNDGGGVTPGVGGARKSTRGIPRKRSIVEIEQEAVELQNEEDLEEEVIFKVEVDSPEDLEEDYVGDGDLEEDFNFKQDPLFTPARLAEESDSDWKEAENKRKLPKSRSRRRRKGPKSSRYPPLKIPPSLPSSSPFVAMSKLPPTESELDLVQCPHCPIQLKSPHNRRLHLKRFHQGPSSLPCPHCHTPWSDSLRLDNHILQTHPEVPPPPPQFQCSECPRAFRDSRHFRAHSKIHKTPRKIHKCPHCSYSCKEATALKNHQQTHLELQDRTLHHCPHCPKQLFFRSSLINHLRIHTGERPFGCPHCPYAAAERNTIKRHVEAIHSVKGKEFMCHKCPKTYKSVMGLKYHLKGHLKEKLKCYFCKRKFNSAGNLRQHMGKHTGEKPPRRFRWDNYREQKEKERMGQDSNLGVRSGDPE